MYKGTYVAKIKIDFHIDPEKEIGFIGIDNMVKLIDSGIFDKAIYDAIYNECISSSMAMITLTRERADLHEE